VIAAMRAAARTQPSSSAARHPCIAGMRGEIQHPAAGGRDLAMVRRAEVVEQVFRTCECLRIGWFDPAECGKIAFSGRLESERGFRHVEALDFRQFACGTALVIPLRPQPDANPGCRASGSAGALVRRGPADLLDEEGVDSAVGIIPRHSGESGIHDHRDPVDCQRCFRDIRGNDDLSRGRAVDSAVLLGSRKFAVEREDRAPVAEPPASSRIVRSIS